MADAGVTAFAMELMPRITRAQVMDVLSSQQANLAGLPRPVIDAAAEYGRAPPMMMTAAGTIPAAKVFVIGGGRRRPAGYRDRAPASAPSSARPDVRPAAKEQVESLGAKFIAVEDDRVQRQARDQGVGYAKEMSKGGDHQAKQAALVAEHVKKLGHRDHDRAHPGHGRRRAWSPRIWFCRCGRVSVIIDLAGSSAAAIANWPSPGEVIEVNGVKIVGQWPQRGGPHRGLGLEPLRQDPVRCSWKSWWTSRPKALGGEVGRRDRQGNGAGPATAPSPIRALRPRVLREWSLA